MDAFYKLKITELIREQSACRAHLASLRKDYSQVQSDCKKRNDQGSFTLTELTNQILITREKEVHLTSALIEAQAELEASSEFEDGESLYGQHPEQTANRYTVRVYLIVGAAIAMYCLLYIGR